MTTSGAVPRSTWSWAGAVAAGAGLAASYVVAALLGVRDGPVVAVAEQIAQLTPGRVAASAIDVLGHADKPVVMTGILLVVLGVSAAVTPWRPRGAWKVWSVYAALAAVSGAAVVAQQGPVGAGLWPVVVGLVLWVGVLELLVRALSGARDSVGARAGSLEGASRRAFVLSAVAVAVVSVAAAAGARLSAGRRATVEEARRLLNLDGVTLPEVPPGVDLGLDAQPRWLTPTEDFYRIDTAFAAPVVDPQEWRLRIHGMVEREIDLNLADLVRRERTEAWVTLNCVSNEVGGDLIGNAWWSGVRLAPLLAEAGVHPEADGVLQTSADGWTCLTPLSVLTDDRAAMLAVAMNGEPLPIEHGFPVRVIVPGLYGYVSATKWVVDLEVTRFDRAQGYWTDKGWSAQGPVRLGSRIDVPAHGGSVASGNVVLAGTAWQQHTGIEGVEVQLDGSSWREAELAQVPGIDSWVQWRATLEVSPGQHTVRVRAISRAGEVQTGAERETAPDGATGWHTVDFTAT